MVTAFALSQFSGKGGKKMGEGSGGHFAMIALAFVVAVLLNYMLGLSKITGGSGLIP